MSVTWNCRNVPSGAHPRESEATPCKLKVGSPSAGGDCEKSIFKDLPFNNTSVICTLFGIHLKPASFVRVKRGRDLRKSSRVRTCIVTVTTSLGGARLVGYSGCQKSPPL